jgi:hypothetical protein
MLADAQYWHDVFLDRGTDKSLSAVSFYQAQAIQKLRHEIGVLQSQGNAPPTDAIIAAVLVLMGTEVRNPRWRSATPTNSRG